MRLETTKCIETSYAKTAFYSHDPDEGTRAQTTRLTIGECGYGNVSAPRFQSVQPRTGAPETRRSIHQSRRGLQGSVQSANHNPRRHFQHPRWQIRDLYDQ